MAQNLTSSETKQIIYNDLCFTEGFGKESDLEQDFSDFSARDLLAINKTDGPLSADLVNELLRYWGYSSNVFSNTVFWLCNGAFYFLNFPPTDQFHLFRVCVHHMHSLH